MVHTAGNDRRPEPALPPIVTRALNVYARCRSYRDRVISRTQFMHLRGGSWRQGDLRMLRCDTAFVRSPGSGVGPGLRFDYAEMLYDACDHEMSRGVLWMEEGQVHTWSDSIPIVERPSMDMAIAGAYGVSNQVSGMVLPALLARSPEVSDSWYRGAMRLKDMREVGTEQFEERDCVRVEATEPASGEGVTMWFESATGLLAGWESRGRLDGSTRTHDRIVIHGEVDVPIAPQALRFTPPPTSKGRAMRAAMFLSALRAVATPIARIMAWRHAMRRSDVSA